MCFVSVGWLESHVFCFCRVVAGMHGIKKFVCCLLAE